MEENAGTLIEKGKEKNVEQNLHLEENIMAPVKAGQKLGEISFTLDGKVLATINIVAKKDVDKINLFTMAKRVCYSWVDLLRS